MKQTRGNSTSSGINSRMLYQQPNSPLRTVFEDVPTDTSSPSFSQIEELTKAPRKLHRNSPGNGRRSRPRYLQLSGQTRTPSALLHNDWYLNQLYNEVLELYKPGTLTGFRLHCPPDDTNRRLSLLRDLAPGCRINPLLPSQPHIAERLRLFHQPDLTERHSEPFLLSMPPKRKATNTSGKSNTPNSKRSTGKKDLINDERHLFSAKSKLMREDLTQFFASPLAWSLLSEDEKEEIRNCLPPGISYDESGAPSQEFLRYDNDWRNHVRLFAEDVEAGRYEPEWLEEAKEASEARRRGDFDRWKEDQFEEFWGQKSDAHADLMAGQAIKLRLGEMVQAGLFRVGDVFVYIRGFGKRGEGYLVEKESTVVEISGSTLTFTMPPGMIRKARLPARAITEDLERSPGKNYRSRSDEINTSSQRVSQPPEAAMRRSNSLQSRNRGSAPPSSRPGTSEGDLGDKDPKPNKKRFGILGSFRRQSSEEKEQSSSGLFKLRRKPVPKMEIVPHPPNLGLTDDSDSPLSSLSSDDETKFMPNPPFASVSSDDNRGSTRTSRKNSFAATSKSASLSPERHIFPRRPLPSRGHSASQSQSQPASKKRPSTSGSNASSSEPKKQTISAFAAPVDAVSGRAASHGKSSSHETPQKKKNRSANVQKAGAQTVLGLDTDGNGDASSHGPLVTVHGIDSLHALEQKVLEVDGRRKGEPRANAWRTFRCLRGGLDLGTLSDMREEYYKARYG